MIKIECVLCKECFEIKNIKFISDKIKEFETIEEIKYFADETGVRFDCPSCEGIMYLSDCEFF